MKPIGTTIERAILATLVVAWLILVVGTISGLFQPKRPSARPLPTSSIHHFNSERYETFVS